MKKTFCLAASLLALNLAPVFGQPAGSPPQLLPAPHAALPPGPTFQERLQAMQRSASQTETSDLTKFNLDFPGGTPRELVAAIEKAGGKPVNVIINKDDENAQMPPIKASEVDVPNLFKTLSENSQKYDANHVIIRNYGFQTIDQRPTDNSLWTFYSYTKANQQTQFSLDFPGGAPAQLVKAIERAMHKPLNVIINKEDENIELPPLKMDDVYLPQLFSALEAASRKTIAVSSGNGFTGSYSQFNTDYGFKSGDGSSSDNSVWYFHMEKPSLPPVVSTQKICHFYNLDPYLNRGFTVDDITTAIQTGWKMAGIVPLPELNYHKETKLLIAYGTPDELATIDNVLRTLPQGAGSYVDSQKVWNSLRQLRQDVDQLTKTNSTPAGSPAGSPAEKSGK